MTECLVCNCVGILEYPHKYWEVHLCTELHVIIDHVSLTQTDRYSPDSP